MKAKVWLISWVIIVNLILGFCALWVYKIDPYFHYHNPDLENYFYTLDNQRSQNDGISKHFEYDAMITGTSMVENFRTTEVDEIFGCNSIKVAYSGASYKEINDNVVNALKANDELKLVIRCLDMGRFFDSYDLMRWELGTYPNYLYDSNPFNDAEYLFNRDVVLGRVYQMTLENDKEGFKPGITHFDDYSRWQSRCVFGINAVCPSEVTVTEIEQNHLSYAEKEVIKKNIELNVTNIADEYPNVDFYYFYSPYSIIEWKKAGLIYKVLEAEEYITELIVPYENIHLFSFNNRTDIVTDLNNYKDSIHYATWVNSMILKWMYNGQYQLTEDNYKEKIKQEYDFYTTFDYMSVNGQKDYEADFYAAALLNEEYAGVEPIDVLNDNNIDVILNGAEYIVDDNNQNLIVDCYGTLKRDYNKEELFEYIRDKEFIGIKFRVNLDDGYNYLCFDGQKIADTGQLTACVYDDAGVVVGQIVTNYISLDESVHKYAIDLSAVNGNITVILNGGYVDYTGSVNSNYRLSNIYVY